MKIGIVQMPVGMDKAQNVACAVENIRRLANLGAQMVVLPEMFCCPYSNAYFREYGKVSYYQCHAETQRQKQAGIEKIYVAVRKRTRPFGRVLFSVPTHFSPPNG